jgi:uncharacterized protein
MEDILASIRRILSEDEAPAAKADPAPAEAAPAVPVAEEPDVLSLDESMLVAEPVAEKEPAGAPMSQDDVTAMLEAMSSPGEPLEVVPVAAPEPAPVMAAAPPPVMAAPPSPDRLIAPEAEAATASSVSSLLRTLETGRQSAHTPVYRGGPTLEDMVRDEIRPLLAAWLDTHLPPMVERLVRAEIDRVVGRAVG